MRNCPNCNFDLFKYEVQKEKELKVKFEETHKDQLTKMRKTIENIQSSLVGIPLIMIVITIVMMAVQPVNPKIGLGVLMVLNLLLVVLFPIKLRTEYKIATMKNLFRSRELKTTRT